MGWVDRIMMHYATCASYTDRGTVYFGEHVLGRFETSFLRDGEELHFQFEWVKGGRRAELHARGNACEARVDGTDELVHRATRSEIASRTGVTFGAAHRVPRQLMPAHVTGRSLEGAEVVAENKRTVTLRLGTDLVLIDRTTLTAKRFGNTAFEINSFMLQTFAATALCQPLFTTLVTYDAVTIVPPR